MFFVLFATAAKPLEIARLVVSDYLTDSRSVREIPGGADPMTINSNVRPLFFASTKVVSAIDACWKNGFATARREEGDDVPRA